MEVCPECGCEIDWELGVCTNCGLVIVDRPIVNHPERKYPDDYDYGTSKHSGSRPFPEYATTHSKKTTNPNLKRAFKSERTYKNINPEQYSIYVDMKRICSSLQLPSNYADEGMNIFNLILNKKPDFFRRRYFKYAAVSAIIIIVCRQNMYPIIMNSIFDISTEKPSHIKRAFFDIVGLLNLDTYMKLHLYVEAAVMLLIKNERSISIRQFIQKVEKIAIIVEKYLNISGRKPIGYIAAIIYMFGKTIFNLKLSIIAKKLGVSVPTIVSRRNEIQKFIRRFKNV